MATPATLCPLLTQSWPIMPSKILSLSHLLRKGVVINPCSSKCGFWDSSLCGMQNLSNYALGATNHNFHFNNLPKWFACTLKFWKYWTKWFSSHKALIVWIRQSFSPISYMVEGCWNSYPQYYSFVLNSK